MAGAGPGKSIFYYGPAPAATAKVELRAAGYPPLLTPAKPIPAGAGLPKGRFFIVEPPGPASVNWSVTLLDSAGHRVHFAAF